MTSGRLAESDALLASIIACSDDAIISKDLEGFITSWNPAAERLFGYSAAEAIGKPMTMLIPHERSEEEPLILGRIARGEMTDHFETVRLRKDGRSIDVSVTISPIRDGEGRIVGASKIAHDITDQKIGDAKVQAQLGRLYLLHQITRAVGERQDIHSIFQVVIRTLEDRLPLDFCCICLYDFDKRCLSVERVGVQSARLAMEIGMTENSRIDIDDNGLSRCVTGQLVYEADITRVPFPFAQRLRQGGALKSMVAAPLLVESKVFGVLIAARGTPESFSSSDCEFLRQLTEHVALAAHQAELYGALQQAYEYLRQTHNAVMEQERLLAVGQMASGIAHDINNAISPITLYTEALLETEQGLSERGRGYLEIIQRSIDDVAQTVARMREFYRQREPEIALMAVDVNRLVQQVIDLTRARWGDMSQKRGIVIEMHAALASALPPILGAEGEIRDALINVIFNAVDAMPEGGKMTVSTRLAPNKQKEQTDGHTGSENECVEITVIDTGIGMDEETRRRCLEPFFTTKGQRGTGLGLAMVYGAMRRHQADIEIKSAPGKGTTVQFRFPLAPTTPADSGRFLPTTMSPPMRILAIDDDPLVLKSLKDTLKADGHEVTVADGGQAGIDAFLDAQARGEPFRIVISDLGMPYVDGRKVCAAIKTAAPKTFIVLLTGWGQRLATDEDAPSHVDRVLGKPPKLRELREALTQALARGQVD
jgi:PAS domain S-box-containing protein